MESHPHMAQGTATCVCALVLGYLPSLAMDQVWIPSHPFLLVLAFLHFPPQRCHQIRAGKVKPEAQVTYCFRPPFPKTLVPLHAGKSTARIHKKDHHKKDNVVFSSSPFPIPPTAANGHSHHDRSPGSGRKSLGHASCVWPKS